jgi:hypothetical protein
MSLYPSRLVISRAGNRGDSQAEIAGQKADEEEKCICCNLSSCLYDNEIRSGTYDMHN